MDESGARGAIDWSRVASESVLPGITRQTVHGARSTVVRYVYQPGAVFPEHAHPEEQTTIVLTGRIVFSLAGAEVEVGPGETLIVPPDAPHGARVVGGATVESINLLAPRRGAAPYSR